MNQHKSTNHIYLKKKVDQSIVDLSSIDELFSSFIEELNCIEKDFYIIGGYLRDVLNGQKSRDLDIISQLSTEEILDVIINLKLEYKKNKLGGFKINFVSIEVDIWSIYDNWANKKQFVKNDNVNSLSKGAFFNYDALVYSYKSKRISTKYYLECIKSNKLDINRKNKDFIVKNPTIISNIQRALYLKNKFGFDFSKSLVEYICEIAYYYSNKQSAPLSFLNSKYNDIPSLDFNEIINIAKLESRKRELPKPNLFEQEA